MLINNRAETRKYRKHGEKGRRWGKWVAGEKRRMINERGSDAGRPWVWVGRKIMRFSREHDGS